MVRVACLRGGRGERRSGKVVEYCAEEGGGYKKLACQTSNQILDDVLLWVVQRGKWEWGDKEDFWVKH